MGTYEHMDILSDLLVGVLVNIRIAESQIVLSETYYEDKLRYLDFKGLHSIYTLRDKVTFSLNQVTYCNVNTRQIRVTFEVSNY